MLTRSRTAVAARIAATLMVVSLSGAPRVLAVQAPVEPHRCTCRMGGPGHHVCNCPMCRLLEQTRAARARAHGSPHARQAPPAEEPAPDCIQGSCGDGPRAPVGPAGVEPFCPPRGPVIVLAPVLQALVPYEQCGADRTDAPELPPPRPA